MEANFSLAYGKLRLHNIKLPTKIDRAAVYVKWSPLEDRFAVGSGSKLLAVCCFDEESDWWIGKKIKKPIRSTVTCSDWHPNNVLLACGSSDFHVRIFSAFTKSGPSESEWGKHTPLGSLLFDHCDGDDESRFGSKITAMKRFQDIDRLATADNTGSRLLTIHQNCINEIRIHKGDRLMASEVSSIGRDGNLVLWNFPALCEQTADLKIV
ncbi:hypothetical protein MN116_009071 [Schistosoma mekongi]|uniref:Arp2/3 complex 41 kDa subunit n=1 Tax=Schistosoma mekongi TaxID=38744 RepID=A0AAE1Z5V4_SCHME|nr:hypothetical protein MN116_009071 [Schistosoma mekongi]